MWINPQAVVRIQVSTTEVWVAYSGGMTSHWNLDSKEEAEEFASSLAATVSHALRPDAHRSTEQD